MAIASLNEVIQSHIMRRNIINRQLTEYSSQKSLAVYEQTDLTTWQNNQKMKIRRKWQDVYSNNTTTIVTGSDSNPYTQTIHTYNNGTYATYSEIEEYQSEIAFVEAKFQDELAELTSWETQLDAQITTENTELSEIKAYLESFKQMLSNNVKNDYQYATQ